MKSFFVTSLLLLLSLCPVFAQRPSAFIHVDQFGYFPEATKVAVLSNPQTGQNAELAFSPSALLEIRRVAGDATVWTGAPVEWNGGMTHSESGDQGWWLDFSELTVPGSYYVFDPGSEERSASFEISTEVYDEVLRNAGRAFYYNRCNAAKTAPFAEADWTDGMNFANPLQDTDCSFVNDRENVGLRRDLSGGWFDAGDYNKYVTFAQGAVQPLLWAYAENPEVFTDNWNIPESGNGIPDILDELKWELDWIRKMVNSDGSVIIKMGSIDFGANAEAPPSTNTGRRYYGPTCTSASIAAAAMLAQAATVFGSVGAWNDYNQAIQSEAETCFSYWLTANQAGVLETDCDDGTINAGDADRDAQSQQETALTAAVHLFELTGQQQYNDYVRDHLTDAEYINTGWWGPYKTEFASAMVRYTQLSGAHAEAVSTIRESMIPHVRDDWNGFYGFNSDDLYRAYMPESSYGWGSNSTNSNYGIMNRLMTAIVPNRDETLHHKADEMVHYLHGVNPLGLVYLTNMNDRGAEHSISEIYHSWFSDGTPWDSAEASQYGPAPGFLSGGPNNTYSVSSISPPAGQPSMKAYKDWNTGYPQNSWEITEPAIYYQAAYIRNLAGLMRQAVVLPVTYSSPLTARVHGKSVLLEWHVAQEQAAHYYEIQYLDNEDDWRSIGRVSATGRAHYTFTHTAPRTGLNDYRLQQVDLDGHFIHTNIVSVNFFDRYANIQLYPNPVATNTNPHLTGLPPGALLQLTDSKGQPLYQTTVRSTHITLPVGELPAGWYQLELSQGGKGVVWARKLILR